jgi:pimeloyl-ACP methyl ester carboxylesterase
MHLATSRETVVLVHGLWMHGLAMRIMQRRLERSGYAVCAYSYATVRCNLEDNAARLARYVRALGAEKVHLVAHSMGGLVAYGAAARLPGRCGRLVLIGTPFTDSYSGRRLECLPGGRWLLGRCMAQWLHGQRPPPRDDFDLGVIAGSGGMGMGRLIAPGLPAPHDGVISVQETRVPGMRDHIVLPDSHTAMLFSGAVARQVRAYLERGCFDRAANLTA